MPSVRDRPRFRLVLLVSTAIAIVSFAVNLTLMLQFRSLGFFFLDDTLFNSDPMSMLEVFSHGSRSLSILYPELRNSIHPYLWFYFGPIIRILAKTALALGMSDLNEPQLRALMGTFVIPLIAMAQNFVISLLLHAMGLRLRQVLLISLVNIAAFSNLIFDAIPEHFAITNLSITVMLLVAMVSIGNRQPAGMRVWIPIGLISAGVTITNIVAFTIVHAITALGTLRMKIARTLARSAVLSFSIGVFVLASAHFAGVAIDGPLQRGSVRDNFVPRYFRDDTFTTRAPLRALSALGNTIAPDWTNIRTIPPTPVPTPHYAELTAPFETSPFPTYTLETAPGGHPGFSIIGIIAVAGMALGAFVMTARHGPLRILGAIALALIGYNTIFHIVWGDEFFIYSQHWITPSLILLSGLLTVATKYRWACESAIIVFAVAVAWNNMSVIDQLLAAARTAAAGTVL